MTAHVLQFAVATLAASLVYHALRAEDLGAAVRAGLRRYVSFLLIAGVFGVALQLFTRWL